MKPELTIRWWYNTTWDKEVGKIKVHIITSDSSILEINYDLIADRIINETKSLNE